ncbi:MAG: pantetheine-phosphate adenylyltransferase [Candidatus Omnitrophica bacterium CG_4_10_14_0_8_um_filter_43_18]|nr:MAG: pantetheine-phosphate adenylyltransferase [Candidatus Omnitrophica bacterium CG_4_10_14_0_8_um_filter_43_18]
MRSLAIYPGSFDPVTYGHIDIIKRALRLTEYLIVAVASNIEKMPMFSLKERIFMLRQATKGLKGVTVDSFNGLAVDYVKAKSANVMIRGLRMISDFEYEFQMALTNRKLSPKIETIFMMPSEEYSYVSSKLIKEAASLGADISSFVPEFVQKAVRRKLKK